MPNRQCGFGGATLVAAALAIASATMRPGFGQTPTEAESLAAWTAITTVLRHPRCLNCHQRDAPLQGDAPRPHVPRVVRGLDNFGAGAMTCGGCHNETGNNPTSRTPGAFSWQLVPVSMHWQGLSSREVCELFKDPARNGRRTPEALIEHVETDPLLLWAWNPGEGRAPVPMPYEEFLGLMKTWVAGGALCPP